MKNLIGYVFLCKALQVTFSPVFLNHQRNRRSSHQQEPPVSFFHRKSAKQQHVGKWKILAQKGQLWHFNSMLSVPLAARGWLVGFSAEGRTGPWECRRRMRGCPGKHLQYRTSLEGKQRMRYYINKPQKDALVEYIKRIHLCKNLHNITEDLHSSVYCSIWC